MREPDVPVTAAVRALRAAGVAIEPFFYPYVDHGGTHQAAVSLGVDERAVHDPNSVFMTRTLEGERDPGAS